MSFTYLLHHEAFQTSVNEKYIFLNTVIGKNANIYLNTTYI